MTNNIKKSGFFCRAEKLTNISQEKENNSNKSQLVKKMTIFALLFSLSSNISYGDVIKFPDGDYKGSTKFNFWKTKKIPNGYGKFFHSDGDKYKGNFENGKADGYVKVYYVRGDEYRGMVKNWKPNGYGKFYQANGDKYKGNFIDGKANGYVKVYYATGDKYRGMVKNWEPDGYGEFFYKNGDKYEGEFKNGKRNGSGKFFHLNGGITEAIFKDDSFFEIISFKSKEELEKEDL